MNIAHPYWIVLAFVAFGLVFWLICDGLLRLDNRAENRHQRRLDTRAKREIRKQFNQIIASQDDGLERP